MKKNQVALMADRRYAAIPVDRIKVMNPRNRDKAQWRENVQSIKDVGMKKPIVVNERNLEKTGYYELVCGQGRYLAFKELGEPRIMAEVINVSQKDALLYSLVENIARVQPGTMWFAYEIKRMHDAGWSFPDISKIVCRTESYIRDYVKLVEQGEARLIKGVEQGVFPITFALVVARTSDADIQRVMMRAFDEGIITSRNIDTVRKIVELRMNHGKETRPKKGGKAKQYTMKQLKADITRITKEQESFVREASVKENRLMTLLSGLEAIWGDRKLVAMLQAEGLDKRPQLKGKYGA